MEIDISYNSSFGELSDVFEGLMNLKRLLAISNGFSGHMPASLTCSPSLLILDLGNNNLGGRINIDRSAMHNFSFLNQYHPAFRNFTN